MLDSRPLPGHRDADLSNCLLFSVEEETCGVAISEVMKVADFERLNRIPLFPNEVLGVTHHRGRVITVLSLAHMLNNQAGEGTLAPQNIMGDGQNKLIIFSREPRNIAVLADFLLGTAPVAPVVQQSSLRPAFTPAAHEGKIIQRLKVDWIFEYVQRLGSAELESPF